MFCSWVDKQGDTAKLNYSELINNSWSKPEIIAAGTNWFVNWADYPMISINKDRQMLAHFLAKSSEGTYSYDVNIVRKFSQSWSEALIPHKDGTPTEHGFVTMIPLEDASFQIAWLDGRNTGGGSHDEHSGGAMTLRTAIVDIQGNITEEYELDSRVCDCCQTSGALTDNGPVIVYRDRSELEIRDMSIVRKVDGQWTTPKAVYRDNWEIAGCPVNGPRVSTIGNNLAVAWFSAPNGRASVKVGFSLDAGQSFNEPIVIDNDNPLGRVDVVMVDERTAMVSWLAKDEQKTVIKASIIKLNGELSAPIVISETDESRGSGFPQMEKLGNKVYFAWTYLQDNGSSTIQIARMEL